MYDGSGTFAVVAEQVVVKPIGCGNILTSLDIKILRKNIVPTEGAPGPSSVSPSDHFCKKFWLQVR